MDSYDGATRRELLTLPFAIGAAGALFGVQVYAQDGEIKEYKKDFSSPKATLETFLAALTAGDIKGTHAMFAEEKRRLSSAGQLPDDHRELYEWAMLLNFASAKVTVGDVTLERTIEGSDVYRVLTAPLTYDEGSKMFPGRDYTLPSGDATALGEIGIWCNFKMGGEKKNGNSVVLYIFLKQVTDKWKICAVHDYMGFRFQ